MTALRSLCVTSPRLLASDRPDYVIDVIPYFRAEKPRTRAKTRVKLSNNEHRNSLDDVAPHDPLRGGHAKIWSVRVLHALGRHNAPHRRVRNFDPPVGRLDRVRQRSHGIIPFPDHQVQPPGARGVG